MRPRHKAAEVYRNLVSSENNKNGFNEAAA